MILQKNVLLLAKPMSKRTEGVYLRLRFLCVEWGSGKQIKFHTLTIENLVPEDHFLRKLDRLVDFSFIYEETKRYYCHHNGRPSIDPVISGTGLR